MKIFRNVESFFQTYIEGFFDRKFSSGLQPVEIGKQLLRKMEEERFISVNQMYVPNHYIVYLNQADYERLQPYWKTIAEELASFMIRKAGEKAYVLQGMPGIELLADELLGPDKFRVAARFTETMLPPVKEAEDTGVHAAISDTRVFKKIQETRKTRPRLAGILTILDGVDTGQVIDIGVNRINIGRRESNELPLTDMNTSRLHAYIVFEEGSHFLYDAKSLNGTYANGQRITRKRLADGDRIKLGNTIILYEVK